VPCGAPPERRVVTGSTEGSSEPADGLLPLPMFPLQTVLFPRQQLPLHVFEPRYRVLAEECVGHGREFGVVYVAEGSEVGAGQAVRLAPVGTFVHVEEAIRLEDDRWALLVRATRRLEVRTWLPDDPYPLALVAERRSSPPSPSTSEALRQAERSVRRLLALESELARRPVAAALTPLSAEPEIALWELCALAPLGFEHLQGLLELDDPSRRALELVRCAEAQTEAVVQAIGGVGA
jgi:Lon protease-like protein